MSELLGGKTLADAEFFGEANKFQTHDANAFLKGKKLKVTRLMSEDPLQFSVEIVEDNTEYSKDDVTNVGVSFSIRMSDDVFFHSEDFEPTDNDVYVDIDGLKNAEMNVYYGQGLVLTERIVLKNSSGKNNVYSVKREGKVE